MHNRIKEGFQLVDTNQIVNEIYSLVKKKFPITLRVSHNQIIMISYEEAWKANKKKNDLSKGYDNNKLTKNEIKIIEDWITEKLK